MLFLSIGLSPLVDVSRLSAAVARHCDRQPGVRVKLEEYPLEEMEKRLDRRELDLAVRPKAVASRSQSSIGRQPFYTEPLYFLPCGSPAQPGNKGRLVLIEEILHETIAVRHICGLSAVLRALFTEHGSAVKEHPSEVFNYLNIEEYANKGVAGGILPRSKISGDNDTARPLFRSPHRPARIVFEIIWRNPLPEHTLNLLRSLWRETIAALGAVPA